MRRETIAISHAALALLVVLAPVVPAGETAAAPGARRSLNVLFIGNSFTGRHTLSQLVKAMAEEGNPGLAFEVSTVLYGGRRLVDHWRLGTQNFVRVDTVTDTVGPEGGPRDKDRDGGPRARVFSERDRADLQRIAWEGLGEFRKLRGRPAPR